VLPRDQNKQHYQGSKSICEAIGKEKVLLDFLTAYYYFVVDSSLEANRKV